MAFFRRTQYYDLFRKKAVTVHVENVTIKWLIDDYVIKIYFPESTTHPELGKIGDEFHVWSSKTTVTIIPDVAPEKDGTPKLEKANNGQTVYTLHIGISTRDTVSFTLKVNDFPFVARGKQKLWFMITRMASMHTITTLFLDIPIHGLCLQYHRGQNSSLLIFLPVPNGKKSGAVE
jgi:hypothetical protein